MASAGGEQNAAVVGRGDDDVEGEDECPLCLETLPPFWDMDRRTSLPCCGKVTCVDCGHKRQEFLDRAAAEGSFGKEEEQLQNHCFLCRATVPNSEVECTRMMQEKFEKGQLPLNLHFVLTSDYTNGPGGVEINLERSNEILMAGANKGDPHCQFFVGYRYRDGVGGLPKSTSEAKRWYLAAAEQGHALAEFELAEMARKEGNEPEFLRYLRESASKGYDHACYNLGLIYYEGIRGVQQSTEEAIRVLAPAAERGRDAGPMGLLGTMMCSPVPGILDHPTFNPNFTMGMHWVRRAAATGDEIGISQLASIEGWASRICFRCGKKAPPNETFLRCSRCRTAWYCSKDCQVQHWKEGGGHKQFCVKRK